MIGSLNDYSYLEVSQAITTMKESDERKDALCLKKLQYNFDKEVN